MTPHEQRLAKLDEKKKPSRLTKTEVLQLVKSVPGHIWRVEGEAYPSYVARLETQEGKSLNISLTTDIKNVQWEYGVEIRLYQEVLYSRKIGQKSLYDIAKENRLESISAPNITSLGIPSGLVAKFGGR